MKKTLIIGMLGFMILPSIAFPSLTHAQVNNASLTAEDKQALVSAITAQIEQLLIQMIGILQQQIQELLVGQNKQIEQLQSTVNNINTNTSTYSTPVGSVEVPTPSLEVRFVVVGQSKASPITTVSSNVNFYVVQHNMAGCPANLRITTTNPEGFYGFNGAVQDFTFANGSLGCNNVNGSRLMDTHTLGTYQINVSDLDSGLAATGEFTVETSN